MQKVVVLSGAGISAESGIQTFRDADGLWEGYDVMEVASPAGWRKNPEMVLEFYNQRRRRIGEVEPNAAHQELVKLEDQYEVVIVTQNIDNLHERAGSSRIIHLHGEILKSRSTTHPHCIYDCEGDILLGDCCENGGQLRPHIVWFGEEVPMLATAAEEISDAHIVIIVGTSMQVYPAAGLVGFAPLDAAIYYVDPRPSINYELSRLPNLEVIAEKATTGVQRVVNQLLQ